MTGADLRIGGQVLSEQLAKVEAEAGTNLKTSTFLTVSPLSIDQFKPDTFAVRNIKRTGECKMILELLDGEYGGLRRCRGGAARQDQLPLEDQPGRKHRCFGSFQAASENRQGVCDSGSSSTCVGKQRGFHRRPVAGRNDLGNQAGAI